MGNSWKDLVMTMVATSLTAKSVDRVHVLTHTANNIAHVRIASIIVRIQLFDKAASESPKMIDQSVACFICPKKRVPGFAQTAALVQNAPGCASV
jgi:hypothetical protein